eukprot:TRINITY_DN54690_c0_g1_i1.p1 TRINITY_DN54690_c0_g1~~TRINITY_DN54690_c0_g1_i1.p1  ORF type:complete len:387 (-),score=85.74 TRINITY_DN54690_c0_g1_i1:60-1220(-)
MARTSAQPARLILHFDVNETIILQDPAGGDTFADGLTKAVMKNAHVRLEDGEAVSWYDGTAFDSPDPPPLHLDWEWPEGCAPAYRLDEFKSLKKTFTHPGNLGQHYQPLIQQMDEAMRWPADVAPDPRLSHDGAYHFVLPALFQTIAELVRSERKATIVVRTFGTDVKEVCDALNAFFENRHFIGYPGPEMVVGEENKWVGRYVPEDGSFALKQTMEGGRCLSSEEDALAALESDGDLAVQLVQDDYRWWRDHGYLPGGGKPLWLTMDDVSTHHVFFDDNIHNLADDSIVAVRARGTAGCAFEPLSGEDTLALHGVHLVRVPTIAPILNLNWFLERIEECGAAWAAQHEGSSSIPVSYTHLRAHETPEHLVCRLLLEKKKNKTNIN